MVDAPVPTASALGGTPATDTEIASQTPQIASSFLRGEAIAKLDAWKRDPAFQRLIIQNNPEALAELNRIQRIVNSPSSVVIGSENPVEQQQRLDTWSNFADLDPSVLEQVRNGQPVTRAEYKMAQQTKERLFQDAGWKEKYMRGDMAARKQLALISIILSSQISDATA